MPQDLPRTWKVVTVWLLLGLAGVLGVQAWQSAREQPRIAVQQGVIELRRGLDGHYHWPGQVNGHEVVFLVDTGATRTALPAKLARQLNLPVRGDVQSQTAGGVVQGEVVSAQLTLQGGVTMENARMVALPALSSPLLGMDVLGRLTLTQQGQTLRITPGTAARAPAGTP